MTEGMFEMLKVYLKENREAFNLKKQKKSKNKNDLLQAAEIPKMVV